MKNKNKMGKTSNGSSFFRPEDLLTKITGSEALNHVCFSRPGNFYSELMNRKILKKKKKTDIISYDLMFVYDLKRFDELNREVRNKKIERKIVLNLPFLN